MVLCYFVSNADCIYDTRDSEPFEGVENTKGVVTNVR